MITNYVLNVFGLLAVNAGECLDVINKVDALYSNAWAQITLIFAIAFGVIPILFQMRWNEMKKELQKDIASGNKDFDKKIVEVDSKILTNDEKLTEKMLEFDRKIEEQKRQLQNETEEVKKQWSNNFSENGKVMNQIIDLLKDSLDRTHDADKKIIEFNQKISEQENLLNEKIKEIRLETDSGKKKIENIILDFIDKQEKELEKSRKISKEYSLLNIAMTYHLSNYGTKSDIIEAIIMRSNSFLELNEMPGFEMCFLSLKLLVVSVKKQDLEQVNYKGHNLNHYINLWLKDNRIVDKSLLVDVLEKVNSKK